jgi:hypothetical protein
MVAPMKRKVLVGTVVAVLLGVGILAVHRKSVACKQRGEGYAARVNALKRDAHAQLKIGTKKDALGGFFTEHGLPITFYQDGTASGTIYTTGCAPFGCGTDTGLIGLRIGVDASGTVISEPVVGALYTNCL